jgi:hypothetical protein
MKLLQSLPSSYACYYDDARRTFLGDVYSVKWMEGSKDEHLSIKDDKCEHKK